MHRLSSNMKQYIISFQFVQAFSTTVQQGDNIRPRPCSKTLGATHKLNFCNPASSMVTSTYELKIVEWDVKQQTNYKTKARVFKLKTEATDTILK